MRRQPKDQPRTRRLSSGNIKEPKKDVSSTPATVHSFHSTTLDNMLRQNTSNAKKKKKVSNEGFNELTISNF